LSITSCKATVRPTRTCNHDITIFIIPISIVNICSLPCMSWKPSYYATFNEMAVRDTRGSTYLVHPFGHEKCDTHSSQQNCTSRHPISSRLTVRTLASKFQTRTTINKSKCDKATCSPNMSISDVSPTFVSLESQMLQDAATSREPDQSEQQEPDHSVRRAHLRQVVDIDVPEIFCRGVPYQIRNHGKTYAGHHSDDKQ
jgi:hypothetical protein